MRTRIITDLDDVLVKSMPAFIYWLSKELGKRVHISDLLSSNPEEFFSKYGITLTHASVDAQKQFFSDERNLENLKPYGARLDRLNCSVITGRGYEVEGVTKDWLRKNCRFEGVVIMTNWDSEYNHKKSDYILRSSPDIYIDDNAQILAEIRAMDSERRTLLRLVTRPWNQCSLRGIKDESYIKRVKGFQEAVSQGV